MYRGRGVELRNARNTPKQKASELPYHRLDEEAVHPAFDIPVVDGAGDVPALVLEREPAVDDQVVVDVGGLET